MDGALHHFAQGRIDKAVTRERSQAVKLPGDDANREVAAALARAHVTHMKVRIVLHFDFAGREGLKQSSANE